MNAQEVLPLEGLVMLNAGFVGSCIRDNEV